jgi:hypothetical protein
MQCFGGEAEGRGIPGNPRHTWKYNIRMVFKK